MAQRGIFISFEGSEGCGKSTQIQLLADALSASGIDFLLVREPGGTAIGEQIRHVLQYSRDSDAMTPESEMLLFAASRAQLVREVIQPAMLAGKIVVSDRFMDSTTIYQGLARKISPEVVASVNAFAVGGCVPDITFLLDMDALASRQRMLDRGSKVHDRMEQEPEVFYETVSEGYRRLAEKESGRICVLDASRAQGEIAAMIAEQLKEKFHVLFQTERI